MALEIERKFLVLDGWRSGVTESMHIVQGYLSLDADRIVRVRVVDGGCSATLTIKGKSSEDGLVRYEWEESLSPVAGASLMRLAIPGSIISKVRHIIPDEVQGIKFEVDVFLGDNDGLIVAEVELPTVDFEVILPDWIGKEVTGLQQYYNSNLMAKPYNQWLDI